MAEKTETEKDLKPVSKIVIKTAKGLSALAFVAGSIGVALGAKQLVSGNRSKENISDLAHTLFLTALGTTGWIAASGADRARNFVETEEAKKELVAAAQNVAEKTHGR